MMTEQERWISTMVNGEEKRYKRGVAYSQMGSRAAKQSMKQAVRNDFMADYINNQTLRTNLHIPSGFPAWSDCSSEVSELYI